MNIVHNIQSLQTGTFSCPSAASPGQTITLSVVVNGVTPPYNVTFCHMVNNSCSFVKSVDSSIVGQVITTTYMLKPTDIGTQTFKANISDSAGHIFATNMCNVIITTTPPPTTSGCTNCDLATNYCIPIVNQCLSKNYVIYGAVGIGALFLLSILKK